jgi:hypothetical protein
MWPTFCFRFKIDGVRTSHLDSTEMGFHEYLSGIQRQLPNAKIEKYGEATFMRQLTPRRNPALSDNCKTLADHFALYGELEAA